ncbi:hypothetical protein V6N11_002492 [Hibiscus sabdariffa]|uniref:Uncharacterized protein n=1 Tax=Hibiscus sabdariffa TaxID=183260 RepID=A0ABR2SAD0_9ROSI
MEEDDLYTKDGTVDYKGNPADKKKTGTWRACPFIIGNECCERLAYYGMSTNLVLYFKHRLNQHSAVAATNNQNWGGTCYITPLIGAFLADSYLGRYWTIACFSIIYIIGMTLLALSASVPGIRPRCSAEDNCNPTETQSAMAFLALYLIALGTGGIKPCVSSYGADQFDDTDEKEKKHKSSFFNWFYLSINIGALIAASVLVWVQDNVSWGWGFGIPAIAMAIAVCFFFSGTRLYRNQKPGGSPLTRMFQLEFFYEQAPDAMRSFCSALPLTTVALGSYLSSLLVTIVSNVTAKNGKPGWIPDNLNYGHIDYFFWLLAALSVLNLGVYIWVVRCFAGVSRRCFQAAYFVPCAQASPAGRRKKTGIDWKLKPKTLIFGLDCIIKKGTAVKAKKKGEMATKVSNFSDLIQRVAASCLLHPLAAGRQESGDADALTHAVIDEDPAEEEYYEYNNSSEDEEKENEVKDVEKSRRITRVWNENGEKTKEMVALMEEVFETVAEMKKAYVRLQEAHCPWDPERMRAADVAVVGELRKLGVLRERFRRGTRGGGGGGKGHVAMLREVVAPYEAAVEDLKREVKVKEVEIENLKEKLNTVTCLSNGGKKGRSLSKRKVSCSQVLAAAAAPTPELFEATMSQVKEASKSFTSLLLSLMREARWDIAAAVRSIEAATATPDNTTYTNTMITPSVIANHHAKYALESYVSRKIFQGFDHETFYMDGSLSSLLNPDQYHRECFTQYRDMKAMDPVELLGILPTCNFGKFCSKKYLAIVHPKMEESLFGDLEQRNQVMAGNHPRSQFYGEFLGLAKAIWLLHLLAFSLDPAPSQFEASRGAEFHPHYMESVGKISGGRVPASQIVGFPVSPGFKLGNGSVVKARVYLVART